MSKLKVAVIGAGPSGLVTLKTLLEASSTELPIEVCLFEAETEIGGTFTFRTYENAELVSSKFLTAFSDFRFPRDCPDHVTPARYVMYLRAYVQHFNLEQHIRLECRVLLISTVKDGTSQRCHSVQYYDKRSATNQSYICSHVIVSSILLDLGFTLYVTDLARNLRIATYFSWDVARRLWANIAHEAIQANAAFVTMCFRTGFLSFPKILDNFQVFGLRFNGRLAIDTLTTNLFETAYVSRLIAKSRLRWRLGDHFNKLVLWFLSGTSSGMNQHVGELPSNRLGSAYTFLNKSTSAMPYLNRPYVRRNRFLSLVGNRYLEPPIPASSSEIINTSTFPLSISSSGAVTFTPDPSRKDYLRTQTLAPIVPDCVIYCTGYTQSFPFLPPFYPRPSTCSIRDIIHPSQPDIAFVGFVRPSVGAIPPIAEAQAMWYTALITGKMQLPETPVYYRLLAPKGSRITYGVNHVAYVSTLAKDFGGMPGLWDLWREHGVRVLVVYCLGASFVTFYRLVGLYRWDGAGNIVKGELEETVRRRGVGNLLFGVLPMLFWGWMNCVAWMVDTCRLVPREKIGQ